MRLQDMPSNLRREIEGVIAWKVNDFVVDRPAGAKVRPVSAKRIKDVLCQIIGFVCNIEKEPVPSCISEVMTRDRIVRFVTWGKNERRNLRTFDRHEYPDCLRGTETQSSLC